MRKIVGHNKILTNSNEWNKCPNCGKYGSYAKNMQMHLNCDSCGQSWILITSLKLNKKKVREFSYHKVITDKIIFGGTNEVNEKNKEGGNSDWFQE